MATGGLNSGPGIEIYGRHLAELVEALLDALDVETQERQHHLGENLRRCGQPVVLEGVVVDERGGELVRLTEETELRAVEGQKVELSVAGRCGGRGGAASEEVGGCRCHDCTDPAGTVRFRMRRWMRWLGGTRWPRRSPSGRATQSARAAA